ncbi:hypothetical protein JCM5350_007530 [Sporobolomyces pararoseus]
MKLPNPFKRPKQAPDTQSEGQSSTGQQASPVKYRREEAILSHPRIVILPPDPAFSDVWDPHASPSPNPNRRGSTAFTNFTPNREPELRVLVVGTGFAGLSCAIALALRGFAVTVLERTNGQSPHGDSVIIGANASRLLHRWGVEDLWEKASQGRWLLFKDSTGKNLHQEDLSALPSQYGAPLLQGKRVDFLGSLGVTARLLGVEIHYNSEVTGYVDSDRPAAYLANGEIHQADTIIVCDGINSTSRCLVTENPERRKSGYSIHRAVMDADPIAWDSDCSYLLDGNIRTWLGKDEFISVYPMHKATQIAFTYTHKDLDSSSSMNWRSSEPIQSVLHCLSGWDPTLQKAISKFPRAAHWTIVEGEVASNWVSKGGKITFAGDAVHPLIPSSIQGATMAIEDAETLAQCLSLAGGRREGVKLALKVYETLRQPRVQEAARLGRKQAVIYQTFTSRNASSSSNRPSPISAPLSSSSSQDQRAPTSAFSAEPILLHPLAFNMYNFDATESTIDSWDSIVQKLDPSRSDVKKGTKPPPSPKLSENVDWQNEKKARRSSLAFSSDSFNALDLNA